MAKSTHTSLIVLEPGRLLRADFAASAGALPAAVLHRTRRAETGVADAVREGLTLGGARAKNVWIAVDELWAQELALPAGAVAGLKHDELAAALAFEAEPLSGIASTHSAVGFLPTQSARPDGSRQFAVVALDGHVRELIQSQVEVLGGKLRGICGLRALPGLNGGDEGDWLKRCLDELARTPAALPLIPPAPRKIPPTRYWATGVLCTAAVLAFCFLHWKWTERNIRDAQAAAETLRTPRKQFDELQKKIAAASAELTKLQEENAHVAAILKNAEVELLNQRARIPAILDSLIKDRPADVAVQTLKVQEGENLRVEGLSLDAAGADSFATKLDTALEQYGLRVQPLSKAAQGLAGNGGPWKFTLKILSDNTVKLAETVDMETGAVEPKRRTTAKVRR